MGAFVRASVWCGAATALAGSIGKNEAKKDNSARTSCYRSWRTLFSFHPFSSHFFSAPMSTSTALHMVAFRNVGVRGTILRRRPDTSQLSDVWVDGQPEVMNGDAVEVLRINAEGENGFSYIQFAWRQLTASQKVL